jgi:tight adherence protein B
MALSPLLVGAVALLVVLVLGGLLFFFVSSGGDSASSSMKGLRKSSAATSGGISSFGGSRASRGGDAASVLDSARSVAESRTRTETGLTIRKQLKYALWRITPGTFHLIEVGISLMAMAFLSLKGGIMFVVIGAFTGPVIARALLKFFVERRSKAFDKDYAPFLLSVVGLLKTGMNPINALEAAAKGLADDALLRQEVELMIERLRLGVPEDKSIGEFGSDIYHPELELFVQALLLSRRVGGTLSDTLERLAKQVRKRQFFRGSAQAAVGLQRGSIWIILLILMVLVVFIYFSYPEAIVGAWNDPSGWIAWQVAIFLILTGIVWIRNVTNLKI